MRTLDEYGLKMCQFQGDVFVLSRERVNCSSPIFIRRFMYSDAAVRMDSEGFLFEATGQEDIIDEITEQFGESSYGRTLFEREELYWIGYLYRYWCYTHKSSSRKLYRMVKPEELRKLYFPYHSLDPTQAIDRIIEANGMSETDQIQKGVQLLRDLKRKKARSNGEEPFD